MGDTLVSCSEIARDLVRVGVACDVATQIASDLRVRVEGPLIGSARNTVGKSTGPTWSKLVTGAFPSKKNPEPPP